MQVTLGCHTWTGLRLAAFLLLVYTTYAHRERRCGLQWTALDMEASQR